MWQNWFKQFQLFSRAGGQKQGPPLVRNCQKKPADPEPAHHPGKFVFPHAPVDPKVTSLKATVQGLGYHPCHLPELDGMRYVPKHRPNAGDLWWRLQEFFLCDANDSVPLRWFTSRMFCRTNLDQLTSQHWKTKSKWPVLAPQERPPDVRLVRSFFWFPLLWISQLPSASHSRLWSHLSMRQAQKKWCWWDFPCTA